MSDLAEDTEFGRDVRYSIQKVSVQCTKRSHIDDRDTSFPASLQVVTECRKQGCFGLAACRGSDKQDIPSLHDQRNSDILCSRGCVKS